MGKEFLEMQQEAARRLREMQSRARKEEKNEAQAPSAPEKGNAEAIRPKKRPVSFLNALDLNRLTEEGDGLILLVILLLIYEESTDELLILALLYILM
ncbi:MAG: hypothetical protein IJY56_02910 [Clostridia bacterium]|nr:hypothetical protein [Clostridia bacterium]